MQPVWGHRRIGEIQHSEVQDWVSGLPSRKGAKVVIRAFGILAGVIDRAVKDRHLPLTMARGVNLPRKGKKARGYLTHHQVQDLAQEAGTHAVDPRSTLIADRIAGLAQLSQVGATLMESILSGEAVDSLPLKTVGDLAQAAREHKK